MKVSVELSGQLKQNIGSSLVEIELDESANTQDLIHQLKQRHSDAMSKFALDSSGQLLPSLLFIVNEKQIRHDAPVALKDGDVAALLSPISGGSFL
ncbi:MAG: MoaD/ThiS family protein [Candidatus Hinthialibacter antarcticus]|nr:MoaD/ThiS family protein [Candidatus Hinthialibacter antarcticus]